MKPNLMPIKMSSKAHALPPSNSNTLDVESNGKDSNAIRRSSRPVRLMTCALQGTMPDRTPTQPPPMLADIISSRKRARQTTFRRNNDISILEAIGTAPSNDVEKQHPPPLQKQRKLTDCVQSTLLSPRSIEEAAADTIPAIHEGTDHDNASLGNSNSISSIVECINSAATIAELKTVLYLQAQCTRDPKETSGDKLADDNARLRGEIIVTNQIDELDKDDETMTETDQKAKLTKRKDKNKTLIVSEAEVIKPRRNMDADNPLLQETHVSATVIANDIKQKNQTLLLDSIQPLFAPPVPAPYQQQDQPEDQKSRAVTAQLNRVCANPFCTCLAIDCRGWTTKTCINYKNTHQLEELDMRRTANKNERQRIKRQQQRQNKKKKTSGSSRSNLC